MQEAKRESTPTGPISPHRNRSPSDRKESSPRRRSSKSPRRSPRRDDRERSDRRDERRENRRDDDDKIATLFVTGLSIRTRDSDLEDKFGKYGKVTKVKLITDPRTSESRGFGFVTMDTAQQADDAVYYLDKSDLDGRVITVEKEINIQIQFSN
jgi:transformer-2 protein